MEDAAVAAVVAAAVMAEAATRSDPYAEVEDRWTGSAEVVSCPSLFSHRAVRKRLHGTTEIEHSNQSVPFSRF